MTGNAPETDPTSKQETRNRPYLGHVLTRRAGRLVGEQLSKIPFLLLLLPVPYGHVAITVLNLDGFAYILDLL